MTGLILPFLTFRPITYGVCGPRIEPYKISLPHLALLRQWLDEQLPLKPAVIGRSRSALSGTTSAVTIRRTYVDQNRMV